MLTSSPWHPWNRTHRLALPVIGLLLIAAVGGCTLARSLLFQTAPEKESVKAEFKDLARKKVLIHVWSQPEVLWEYPQIRLDVSAALAAYLKEHLKGVEVVDPERVEQYIRSQSTSTLDPVQLGRQFQAEMVIELSIYKFSVRDPGMSQFYRGRLSSSVVVHDLTPVDGPARRTPLQDVTVVVPEEGPVGFYNVTADQVRDATYAAFTQSTGRKFHDWERQLD